MREERFDLVFRAPRVVTAAGEVARCVAVRDGRVAAIEPLAADLAGERTVTLADDEVLLPGLVDTHVHVNEPGRTAGGFRLGHQGGSRRDHHPRHAAQLDPPTVDVAALEVKRKAAEGQVHVDVGFWAAPSPGTSASCAACTTPACSAVLPAPLRGRRVPPT